MDDISNVIDLINKRFGMLTVIEKAGTNGNGQLLWKCLCDCGENKVANGCNLRSGRTWHCGCQTKTYIDITNRRSADLVAIKTVGRNSSRTVLWECKCNCGRTTIVRSTDIISQKAKSCGKCSFGSYEIKGNKALGHFKKGASFIIDVQDVEFVKQFRWWIEPTGYFTTNVNGKGILLHNFLLGNIETEFVVDHIDRNKSNNSRANLRICTAKENSRNRSLANNNTSGYTGVCYHIRNHKYYSSIKVNNKTIHLGVFDNKVDAAKARDIAAEKYFGKFARLNFSDMGSESKGEADA